jgi:hypothetical protein
MHSSSIDTESVLQTITAMCSQEETGYICDYYLYQHEPEHVDTDCRNKMAEWCYQIVGFLKFSRDTVSIAMSYLDRFMLTPEGASAHEDREIFQLAAITCLYTAIKIHEPNAMAPKSMSELSRGAYSPGQVEAMEAQLLSALEWRMNPPTALAFVLQFLELIPLDLLSETMRKPAYDLATFQTELAAKDYDFVPVKASTIAFGSLMNSLESLGFDAKVLGQIGFILSKAIGIDCTDDMVLEVQTCLYQAVNQPATFTSTETTATSTQPQKAQRRSSLEVSPCSV